MCLCLSTVHVCVCVCVCAWTGAKKVVGLELCGDAVKDAKRNAAANSVSNCEFEVGHAEDTIPQVNPDQTLIMPCVVGVGRAVGHYPAGAKHCTIN